MDKPDQIALLIDSDNATAARIDVILDELSGLGETNIRRAYGNWTKTGLKSWQEVLHDNAIRPVQQFDVSKGKNASDIALAVDAVHILNTQRPDAFALVSSDADFTPLVMHLREHGARVYGFGDAKTPLPFQSACTRFLVLNRLAVPSALPDAVAPEPSGADAVVPVAEEPAPAATRRRRATATVTSTASTASTPSPSEADADTASAAPAAKKTTARKKAATQASADKAGADKASAEKANSAARAGAPEAPARLTRNQLRSDAKLVALLRRTVEGAADDAGWARVGTVGQRISNQSSFDPRNYGYAKLSKLLEATDLFELRDIGGPGMAVRDRRTSTNGTSTGTS
ncbi:MAG TPA: NYN domain-containing protein [Ornithinibacter sp.]|nr:NYN domain-containing protein [Ornithinibacter sp.]